MGFLINQTKLKRNRIMRRKPTNLRLNRNKSCRAPSITEILSNNVWKDKTCFLIGGGPSLKGFDFTPIKNELTIGVNKSFIEFPTTINYAMDWRFYNMVTSDDLYQQWASYKGIKLFLKRSTKSKFNDDVYVVNSLREKGLSLDLHRGIWGGNNSGFGALMLAICLGATRIGLLGYSMKVQKEQNKIKTHWHGGYGLGRAGNFQSKLDKFRVCFEEFSSVIAKQGIEVVNLVEKSEDSKLTCFPKDFLENFLK